VLWFHCLNGDKRLLTKLEVYGNNNDGDKDEDDSLKNIIVSIFKEIM